MAKIEASPRFRAGARCRRRRSTAASGADRAGAGSAQARGSVRAEAVLDFSTAQREDGFDIGIHKAPVPFERVERARRRRRPFEHTLLFRPSGRGVRRSRRRVTHASSLRQRSSRQQQAQSRRRRSRDRTGSARKSTWRRLMHGGFTSMPLFASPRTRGSSVLATQRHGRRRELRAVVRLHVGRLVADEA